MRQRPNAGQKQSLGRFRRPRGSTPFLRASTMRRSTSAQNGGRNAGGGDDEADSIPITETFASATVRPEKPMTKNKAGGGLSNIASAAVGGLDTDTGVDNDVGDSNVVGQRQSSRTQQQQQQKASSSSSSMSKLFGACGPAEALDLDMVRGAATKLRIPTRTESAEFVKNLSLPERLRDVKDGLNAKLGACVSTSKGDTAGATSGSKSPRVGQGNASSSSNAQGVHRSSATTLTTTSVDESSHVSYHTFETKDTKQEERLEEMHHLERMTSWNTLGTISQSTHADDASIDDNINAMGMLGLDNKKGRSTAGGNGEGALEEYIASSSPPKQPIVDDDGNEISSEMITSLKARREQRAAAAASAAGTSQRTKKTSSSRRRVVQFDYPPISSLRECPRHDPADQGKLFFSEEELDELEEDRIACKMVDDVEVVAVSAVASAASSSPNGAAAFGANGQGERGGKKMTKREARKLALSASQKLKRSSSASASPNNNKAFGFVRSASASMTSNGGRAFGIAGNSTANDDDDDDGRSPTTSPANAAGNNSGAPEGRTTDNSGGPLIKGVQIYLRQRSTNEVVKKGRR